MFYAYIMNVYPGIWYVLSTSTMHACTRVYVHVTYVCILRVSVMCATQA